MLPKFEERLNAILRVQPLDDIGLPIFHPRTMAEEDHGDDKYEKDWTVVTRYTGLAYGFKSTLQNGNIGWGGAEGLYRTVSSFVTQSLGPERDQVVLDLGCGVGRTIYDCAPRFPSSVFVGMDFAYKMCIRAKEVLLDGATISLDGPKGEDINKHWAGRGFPSLVFEDSLRLENVKIMQGSATNLPFKDESIDCVVNTLLLDRVRDKAFEEGADIAEAIREMVRVLKKGGHLVLSTPLDFGRLADWSRFRNAEGLVDAIANQGVIVHEKFDGLVYREIADARGNYEDWLVLFIYGSKA